MRLRQIDLLGVQYGAEVALELAAVRPELVRRLVLVGRSGRGTPGAGQTDRRLDGRCRTLRQTIRSAPPSQKLAEQIGAFLRSDA